MMRTMFCVSCGSHVGPEWTYCRSCASRQPTPNGAGSAERVVEAGPEAPPVQEDKLPPHAATGRDDFLTGLVLWFGAFGLVAGGIAGIAHANGGGSANNLGIVIDAVCG